MNEARIEEVIISVLKQKMDGLPSAEFDVSDLQTTEIELLRYTIMDLGFRAEFYTETRKTFLAVWLK